MKLSYLFTSKTGLRRSVNEDYVDVFEIEDGLLAVVCDGLGGNKGGEVASRLAVTSIYKYFVDNPEDDILFRIKSSVFYANAQILAASGKNRDLSGMATTVVMLYLNKKQGYFGHVGDSRIYFYSASGLDQITRDHSLVQKLLDDGHINEHEAEAHPHKNVIMRAVGDKNSLEVDTNIISFERTEPWKFFLCSDGVSNFVRKEELAALLAGDDLEYISKTLSVLIEERGAPDNYSFVIISNQV